MAEQGGFLDQDPLLEADRRAFGAWYQFIKYGLEHPDGEFEVPANGIAFRDLIRG